MAETIGLEERGGYYDGAGALRDMVQNHMLQLLALVAMEPPADFDATSIRDEKVKVLRSLRAIHADDVPDHVVTGQYGAGAVGGHPVRSYAEELGRESGTETFVALKAHLENWRWAGVPFYLRTGKRMPERKTEIFIQFKCVPHSIFAKRGAKTKANKLIISIQPEENIRLLVMAKTPGLDREGIRLREVPLDVGLRDAFADTRRRIAYERLLLDLIDGDPTLFVRRDEVEAQWQWIDGVRAAWEEAGLTPKSYGSGSWGPSSAIALTERDGVQWHESARPPCCGGYRPDHRTVEADAEKLSRTNALRGREGHRPPTPQLRKFRARLRRVGRRQGCHPPHARAQYRDRHRL